MEGEYEKIREQALQEATVGVSYQTEKEPDKAAEPEKAAEPGGAEQSVEVEPQKPKKAKAAKKAEAQEGSAGGTTERPPRQSVLQETTVGVAYQKQPKENSSADDLRRLWSLVQYPYEAPRLQGPEGLREKGKRSFLSHPASTACRPRRAADHAC